MRPHLRFVQPQFSPILKHLLFLRADQITSRWLCRCRPPRYLAGSRRRPPRRLSGTFALVATAGRSLHLCRLASLAMLCPHRLPTPTTSPAPQRARRSVDPRDLRLGRLASVARAGPAPPDTFAASPNPCHPTTRVPSAAPRLRPPPTSGRLCCVPSSARPCTIDDFKLHTWKLSGENLAL
ncbi:hypothetical protein GUJ93_ZPchr0002g25382 [Zizania palustris]|uniref:Uncharacterized protein n=1 Tax=Zizania palustris TaxID=103762 RepID=A0A8J5S628_ZIZPA|nr:hypothetical protein GUJ93_ZPchr0002g25382 [Zizania palustris]